MNFNSLNLSCCGGNRFIFEMSNALAERNHKVSITHAGLPRFHDWYSPKKAEILDCGPNAVNRVLYKAKVKQYNLQTRLCDLQKHIPDCDVNVATYCLTAKPTVESSKGKPFYLVQHYEPNFFTDQETKQLALDSYKLPMKKLCVSEWLTEKVNGDFIGNGVNLSRFKPCSEPKKHDVLSVMRKGTALKNNKITEMMQNLLLKEGYTVKILDGFQSEEDLVKAYNQAKVTVYLAEKEGFGYIPLESMACGTPVIIPFNCVEYASRRNAFILPTTFTLNDVFAAVKLLLNGPIVYDNYKVNGLATAKRFDFKQVVDRFESCISSS